MNAIDKIYSNNVGISFFWKKEKKEIIPKIQLVFRDMGFLLTLNELKDFSNTCNLAKKSIGCSQCESNRDCRSILLKTPSEKIDLAVSKDELEQIQELISGTVFKLDLKQWAQDTGLN